MDKETVNRIALRIAEALNSHSLLTKNNVRGAKVIIAMELDREFVRPLEELNRKMMEKDCEETP